MKDEFYIGWQNRAAAGTLKLARRGVILAVAVVLLVGAALALSQRLIGVSVFEWGNVKTFSGVLLITPCPCLLVPRPGDTKGQDHFSSYLLVAPWKFGLKPEILTAFAGKPVSLKGTLIYRGRQTMIEVAEGSIQADAKKTTPALPETISLGRQTFVGEIVDSKCFFGVMNPGQLAPHRACAIRCLSGGIPPVLLVQQKNGPPVYLLLVSTDGRPVNRQILDFVAEPVRITGEVERQGGLLILRADPADYQRL